MTFRRFWIKKRRHVFQKAKKSAKSIVARVWGKRGFSIWMQFPFSVKLSYWVR